MTIAAACGSAVAYEDGAPAARSGGFGEATCHACHSDHAVNAKPGGLTLAGLPMHYRPGIRYAVTLSLTRPTLASGGFQLSMRTPDGKSAGRLSSTSARVERVEARGVEYLQHSNTGRQSPGDARISWSFEWRAPDRGDPVLLHIAANAANDDLSALGDYIYTLERHIEPCDR